MSAHAVNIHAGSSGAGVCWYPEMGWFRRSWHLDLDRPSCSCDWGADLTWISVIWGSLLWLTCPIQMQDLDLSFSCFPWGSVLFAHTTWGLTLGRPPCLCLLTNEMFCDLTCVHFKFDYLLEDQCSVALHEGCFRGVLAGVFPVCSSSVCAQVRAPRGFYRRSSRQQRFAF